jgi:hypothetical protein
VWAQQDDLRLWSLLGRASCSAGRRQRQQKERNEELDHFLNIGLQRVPLNRAIVVLAPWRAGFTARTERHGSRPA